MARFPKKKGEGKRKCRLYRLEGTISSQHQTREGGGGGGEKKGKKRVTDVPITASTNQERREEAAHEIGERDPIAMQIPGGRKRRKERYRRYRSARFH